MNANFIRQRRAARSWTQEHLAAAAGLSAKTIRRAEAWEAVSAETRLAIAAALEVPTDAVGASWLRRVIAIVDRTASGAFALDQAIMAICDQRVPAIVTFGETADPDDRTDPTGAAFAAELDVVHRRAEPGRLRQTIQEIEADVVFVAAAPAAIEPGSSTAARYAELAECCDLVVVPVTAGGCAERAAILAARSLALLTRQVVFLIYERVAHPVSWTAIFGAQARMIGIETIDWVPRHEPGLAAVKEKYRRAVDRSGPGGDETRSDASYGVWRDIERRVRLRAAHAPPPGDLRGTPADLEGAQELIGGNARPWAPTAGADRWPASAALRPRDEAGRE